MEQEESTQIYLEYGDIIKIHASSNKELHQQSFFIKYINNVKISLINISTLYPYVLYYSEEEQNKLRDESIEQIDIIWKSQVKGYIAQNGLELHKWIDIHFGGDFPVIFTGEITEIQDDQMEVTLYPSLEIIYIDFEYKGLPEDKFIEKIILRNKPLYIGNSSINTNSVNKDITKDNHETEIEEEVNAEIVFNDKNESVLNIPSNYNVDSNIKDILHNMYIDANDIIFDTGDIEIVNQVVEVDSKNKIYTLDEQITNLLDELLSNIPNNGRTKSVMDNIQRIITSFKRLRSKFSKIDEYGNIESPLIFGIKHKPLVEKIHSLSSNLRWIIPVVSLNKTLYSEETEDESGTDNGTGSGIGEENIDQPSSNIKTTNLIDNLKEILQSQTDYFKNTNNDGTMSKYSKMIKSVEKNMLPYSNIELMNNFEIIEHKRVETDIEAIIDNLQEFKTIVYKNSKVNLQKYVIQKYNLGTPVNWLEGKKQMKKTQLTPNETIDIKSILMLPEEIMRFSRIDLPMTDILTRSTYSHSFPMTYRIFNKKLENNLERIPIKIENNNYKGYSETENTEFNYEKHEKETNIPFLSNFKDFTIENPVDEDIEKHNTNDKILSKRYGFFLDKIIPTTYDLLSLIQRYLPKYKLNGYSLVSMASLVEPFAIYPSNITYNTYVRIRYFIKQSINAWKKEQIENQKNYRLIREKKWNSYQNNDIVQKIFELFKENNGLQNIYYTTYKKTFEKFIQHGYGKQEETINTSNMLFSYDLGDTILSPNVMGLKTSEVLNSILNTDCGKTTVTALRLLLVSLTIPDNLITNMLNENDEGMTIDKLEKIKPSVCSRRFLTKKYKSLRDLQNDNHKEIFYDKEYDNTPYDLMTKEMKGKKEKMQTDEFLSYFAEILVQKYGISRNASFETANTIIKGKKTVLEGEYAVLETYPIISVKDKRLKEEDINENGDNIEETKTGLTKTYYIRKHNVWRRDDMTDDSTFMDNNTLFCNLTETEKCVKRSKPDVCEKTEESRREILAKTRASLYKELDERIEESIDSLKNKLEKELRKNITRSKIIQRIEEIQLNKENKYAFDLGEIDKYSQTVVQHSKWEVLLEKILSQVDFVKKQNDILTFADKFTREPMEELLGDSPYWYYCRETNLKLLPIYIYDLAKAYVVGGSDEYAIKLKEVVRKYGTLSEDGDSIVDGIGGSGRVIQKIEFVEEEIFNDDGFKVQSKNIIEKDIETIVSDAIGIVSTSIAIPTNTKIMKNMRLFENETNEIIYNILVTICRNIGISTESIEDNVIRISSETISTIVVNEKKYYEKMKKVEKPKPYVQYKNQNIILIVGFVTLLAIQCSVPPLQPENTVPGCIVSFEGFPFEGGEDGNTDGLRYIACVLNISKSSIGVWSAIQSIKNPVQTFMDAMIKSISKQVIQREDVLTMISKKREYLTMNPDNGIVIEIGGIAKAHNIKKWTTFLPPLISYKIVDKLSGNGIPETFLQGLKKSLIKGDPIQWQEIGIIQTKFIEYTFAIIEYINIIVKKNKPLLNTVNSIPFLQNSCCNDENTHVEGVLENSNQKKTVLQYFANKENDITRYINIVDKLAKTITLNDALSLAHIFVHSVETARKSTIIPKNGHSIENIYQSFIHYCKFDNETAPIPEYLKLFVSTKPTIDYNPHWTIEEKIKYLKENGKNYNITDLERLISSINNKNSIDNKKGVEYDILPTYANVPFVVQIPNIDGMLEYMNYLDDTQETISGGVIEEPLKKHIRAVLSKYQPNTMSYIDNEEISTLKNYLIYSNGKMIESIYNYFDEYRGSIDSKRIEEAKIFVRDFTVWEEDTDEMMAKIVQYTKNTIYDISVLFPTMIYENKPILKTVPLHWNLSLFHRGDVEKFIELYYTPLLKFMGDNSIKKLLFQISESLKILINFMKHIPVVNPLRKNANDEKGNMKEIIFYSVFDKDSIYLLFKYLFYSVIYEYIQKSNEPEILKIDRMNIRNKINAQNKMVTDSTEEIKGFDTGDVGKMGGYDEIESLNDIQLQIGNLENIKRKTVELLVTFLSIEKDTKKAINKSYKTINERVLRTKLDEKKTITDYFKNMLDDERKVEYTLKKMKMGRWNLGMQKGVFEYDKNVYDKERSDIVSLLIDEKNEISGGSDDYVIQPEEKTMDVIDLEMNEQKDNDEEYEKEEWDIQNMGEDYMDGNYYNDDEGAEERDFNDN